MKNILWKRLRNKSFQEWVWCVVFSANISIRQTNRMESQITRFMGPTWGPPGSCRPRWAPCWPHEPCYQGHFRAWFQYQVKVIGLQTTNFLWWLSGLTTARLWPSICLNCMGPLLLIMISQTTIGAKVKINGNRTWIGHFRTEKSNGL